MLESSMLYSKKRDADFERILKFGLARGPELAEDWLMLPQTSDLAPGDTRSASLDIESFDVHMIHSSRDEWFEPAYQALWAEFGAKNEMERRETLEARFTLAPAMVYEMVLVRKDGELAAVRDHTIVSSGGEILVHLSHNLVMPKWRRSGLAGWMRALPVVSARQLSPGDFVTLAGEMEYDDGRDPDRAIRLKAYEQAGFLKIDPAVVRYYQPDFRAPEVIDQSGGARPLPFQLIIRRVGREEDRTITGSEARRIVHAIYRMYGAQFRPQDMAHPSLALSDYPSEDQVVALVPPTA
jgi:hypothetical protein